MTNKWTIFFASLLGELIKLMCWLRIVKPRQGINELNDRQKTLVVSLTSYGRRVRKTVPYTIISLLRQTYKADKLVLWLDKEHWNKDNVPMSLKKLEECGLTIKFCEDLKSYKKLVPSLKEYPDSLIITTDDDVFYKKNTIERLVKGYYEDKSRIYCHTAHGVKIGENDRIASYADWTSDVEGESGLLVFPVGEGCILYDKALLHEDVIKQNLFQQLAPFADDVWFYFMSKLKRTESCQLPYQGLRFLPLDFFYQYTHRSGSLAKKNCGENMNDKQINNVMQHYGIGVDSVENRLILPPHLDNNLL